MTVAPSLLACVSFPHHILEIIPDSVSDEYGMICVLDRGGLGMGWVAGWVAGWILRRAIGQWDGWS